MFHDSNHNGGKGSFVYSKTCLGRPPMGRIKSGLSRQVVSEARESRLLIYIYN